MGKERARSASTLGAQILAVCDTEEGRASALADAYPGCRPVDTVEALIAMRPSAIFICTPPGSRGAPEIACIQARIPFLTEKPIGTSAAQVAHVREALRRSPLVHSVGYHNRVRRSVRHARSVLSGKKILAINGYWVGRKYQVPWWLRSDESGGPVNEQATHMIDLCRWLCGEIVEATCALGSVVTGSADPFSANILLRFDSGAFGSLFYSCEATGKQIGLRIITDLGGITLSSWELNLTHNDIDSTGILSQTDDIFLDETREFLEAVRSSNPRGVACDFEDAWRSQSAVDQILAANGRWRTSP